MKRAFVAAALISLLPSIGTAAPLRSWWYTDRCWNFDRPLAPKLVELSATVDGVLLWNGGRADWRTFRFWLNDLFEQRDPDWDLYVAVDEKMPHRKEIITVLAKGGLALRRCPFPKPPKFEPAEPKVY